MSYIMEKIEKIRNKLFYRRQCYLLVFNLESQAVQQVLYDLAKFCRANDSTYERDPRDHAVREGRREVWLRIQKHIKLDPEEFIKTYGKGLEQ